MHEQPLAKPIAPPPIAPPMLLATQMYTQRIGSTDPDAQTDEITREELAFIVEEMRSPNRIARDVLKYTWAHAKVRRTEVVLDRRGFRKRWRQNRDAAIGSADIATASLATILVDAIDRKPPESLVVCLCDIDEQTWEIFVDIHREELLGARRRVDIW